MSYEEALEKIFAHYATMDREQLLETLQSVVALLDPDDVIAEAEDLGL